MNTIDEKTYDKKTEVIQSFRFNTVDSVTTNLDAIQGKKTRLCFTDSLYSYRSDDIDYLLPENQLRTGKCSVRVFTLPKDTIATFEEQAIAFLDFPKKTPVKILVISLKMCSCSHIMSLPKIEKMIEITEKGLETGISSDGSDNFAFLENRKQKISVGCFSREESGWAVSIYNFEDRHHWPGGSRLLVKNLYLK